MPLLEVNGVQLFVEESGNGDPLVLVHGSWVDRQTWALIEEDLARSFRVVSYDRRGHSQSKDDPEPRVRRDDEDDLAALIETLGLGPANVLGNSFGGAIALGLAARRPELFRRLAAHEPPLFALAADDPTVAGVRAAVGPVLELIERGDDEAAVREFVENIALGPGGWEALPEEQRASMAANSHTFLGEALDPTGNDLDVDGLSGVAFPVLLTRGDQSPPVFSRIIARVAEAIDGAELRVLPGAGHVPQRSHPAEFVSVVSLFFAGSQP